MRTCIYITAFGFDAQFRVFRGFLGIRDSSEFFDLSGAALQRPVIF